ncbi:pyridoxal-phosphate dependent enzyme [Microbacterium schleiferi]|uniref:Pyridoxal-phosphate dependent enzyme n=2 Tax=Microbacterium schleiferi TaxID=69362 RepID=A0A7S8MVR6_9MICO|nr:pyridoxal-phosphate dependent enzyme [Microbacterium schleiferi]
MGREYFGIELRAEQIEANEAMMPVVRDAVAAQLADGDGSATWVAGPVAEALGALPDESFDIAFSEPPAYPTDEWHLTPVDRVGALYVKRDDTFVVGESRGGKVRSCLDIAMRAKEAGARVLVTAGSRQSPQVAIVADVAAALGLEAEAHVPEGAFTPELSAAQAAGARIVQHKAGHNNVIVARAREAAAERDDAVEVPFGMETPVAVDLTSRQVENLPADVERIVIPVGSGMSLAGVLWGLRRSGRDVPVLGVMVGADPEQRLDKYAPADWREMVELVPSGLDYHDHAPETKLGPLSLDPIYEAKTLPFLRDGDLLWVVGIRGSAVRSSAEWIDPTWIEGDSTIALADVEGESFDMALGCPPYYDLESYSDDPRDLSNLSPAEFDAAMARTVAQVGRVLRDDSFAVFVVGSVRDKKGHILDMRRCMSQACEAAGMALVNDAVLLTPVGSAAMRAARGFRGSRTLARVHQEVLVYVKGSRKAAADRLGPVSFAAVREVEKDGEE